MSDLIFEIKNLNCAYAKDKPVVLKIDSLKIPRNKVVFLLGSSGCGKSTLLETLGLMNNTISEGSELIFYPSENKAIPLQELWEKRDHKTLADIRNEYFSFIFQSTNLMPNFSAYENIAITRMLQGDSQSSSIQKAKDMLNRVNLGNIPEEKKAHELSGGERQRVAFVRAIIPEHYSVLFGDEPTGNLDEINSRDLMKILKEHLTGKTAFIVSHNVDLAIEFADIIIVLTKKEKQAGEIKTENYFIKQFVSTSDTDEKEQQPFVFTTQGKPVKDIRNTIITLMNTKGSN